MNCSEVQELLSAYYDGEVAADIRTRVSEHLDGCSECAQPIARYEKLSEMATAIDTPAVPERIWSEIEQQLDRKSLEDRPALTPTVDHRRETVSPLSRRLALAAMILVAVGIGWFAYQSRFQHDDGHFTAEIGHYLQEFQGDPAAAQQFLLAKYGNQSVDPQQAMQLVGYRPAVADGLPDGYSMESMHVIKMPCCTCVKCLCRRSDGSTIAIFEHDDDELDEWFGDRPERSQICGGKRCSLVELDSRIAVSWKHGKRHITVIGVRDVAEVEQLVTWFDKRS